MLKIIGVGLTGAVASLTVKQYKPEVAMVVGTATAVILFFMLLSQVSYVLSIIEMMASNIQIKQEYITAVFKMIAMAYLSQLGSEMCRDAGQNAIAAKIELAGKIFIVVFSIPILLSLMNLLLGLLP